MNSRRQHIAIAGLGCALLITAHAASAQVGLVSATGAAGTVSTNTIFDAATGSNGYVHAEKYYFQNNVQYRPEPVGLSVTQNAGSLVIAPVSAVMSVDTLFSLTPISSRSNLDDIYLVVPLNAQLNQPAATRFDITVAGTGLAHSNTASNGAFGFGVTIMDANNQFSDVTALSATYAPGLPEQPLSLTASLPAGVLPSVLRIHIFPTQGSVKDIGVSFDNTFWISSVSIAPVLTSVPEPSSGVVMGLGMAALVLLRSKLRARPGTLS